MISYSTVLNYLEPIRANWARERCKPEIIPFAGIINNSPNTTPSEFAVNNFTSCVQGVLENIVDYAIQPIQYLVSVISSTIQGLAASFESVRGLLNNIRDSTSSITQSIMSAISNLTIPVAKLSIHISDILRKVTAAMEGAMGGVMSAYLGAQSLMLVLVDAFITILIAISIAVAAFWWIPFVGPPLALAGTATFILLLIPTVRIQSFMKDILKLRITAPPPKPACFSKNTKVALENHTIKNISDLKIGDILIDKSTVTGTMKLSSKNQPVYILHGVVVTGNHSVYHDSLGWIAVENHPNSLKLNEFHDKYVYCVNTDSKTISLGNTVFADWDDIDDIDIDSMHNSCVNIGLLPHNFTMKDIHCYLDNGFHEESVIKLKNNKTTSIKDAKIGDITENGDKIIGTVKIDSKDIKGVYYFNINGIPIKCSKNVTVYENNEKFNTSFMNGNTISDVEYLYNIITDSGKFNISGIIVEDYNYGLEQFLQQR